MDSYDQYDMLNAALNDAKGFPANLMRSQSFEHDLVAYNQALLEQESRLFLDEPDYSGVKLVESYDGYTFGPLTRYRTVDELRSHFQAERKDPRCRHVFITADHSRAPLDCSMEAFTYTLSFLQTMPRFLELAFTFGEQEAEKDFHYTAFNSENFLDNSSAERYCIPRLGRSGREIRHCFNLWSVEVSDTPPYSSIRQTAIYHCFDVGTGRAAWVNIKGNELMQKRITQALGSTSRLQPSSLKTTSGSFSASLLTLLIVLEWSGENWKSQINDLERQLSNILMKAKNAPVKSIEEAISLDANVLLQQLAETEEKARKQPRRIDSVVYAKAPHRTDTLQSVLSSVSPKRILSGLSRPSTSVDPEKRGSPVLTKAKTPPSPIKLEPLPTSPTLLQQAPLNPEATYQSKLSVLQEFTVDGLQKLTDVSSRIHEVKLVMKLNTEVINELIGYYKTLAESDDMPMDIKKDCAADLNSFFRRARAVIRHLEMEQSRSDTLIRMSEIGKSLFDNISAKHVVEMTEDMHQSSIEMKAVMKSRKSLEVAEKTATKTSLGHFITWVTLFFLPIISVTV